MILSVAWFSWDSSKETIKLSKSYKMSNSGHQEGKLACHGSTIALLNARFTLKETKYRVLKVDWESSMAEASQHASMTVASHIASTTSWVKLWDMTLDQGPNGTCALQALYHADKTRISVRNLSQLWVCTGCFLLLSLHSLSYATL